MSQSTNRRVLVIDDNESIHADFEKILAGAPDGGASLEAARSAFFGGGGGAAGPKGFEVSTASQGVDGITAVKEALAAGKPYAMAFVDVRMPPGIDGIQTIKGLWEADEDLQVVICTAFADYSLEEITEELGQSNRLLILKKPFDPVEVRQLAAALTQKWTSARRERETLEEVQRQARSLEEANRELREATERLEEASRVKSEFLANMSHEIRTPMTSILGYLDLLFDPDVGPEESASYREIVRRSGQQLLVIINDILDISKIEAGRMLVFQRGFDPRELCEEALAVHRADAEKKGLALELHVAESVPAELVSDPVRVQQVLGNLLGNAVKFTQQGSIRLDVEREGETARFTVTDTGMGIAEADLPSLFDAFTQADGSSTRTAGGTGLGLAISKQLAALLGGDVEVESEEGTGSRFRLVLPLGEPTDAAAQRPAAGSVPGVRAAAPEKLAGRYLLVEDGRLNQVLIATILRKSGLEVDVASNGEEGCERVEQAEREGAPYDLVLMDMQMPVLDGYDATRRLRAGGFERPIVALTAHAMSSDRQKCLEAGCTDYATKPVDRRALLALCHRLTQEDARAPFPTPRSAVREESPERRD